MIFRPLLASLLLAGPASAADQIGTPALPTEAPADPIELTQSLSCSPRKTCKMIWSCDEAYWYLRNCSWGYRLDGDNDGVPCESICPGG